MNKIFLSNSAQLCVVTICIYPLHSNHCSVFGIYFTICLGEIDLNSYLTYSSIKSILSVGVSRLLNIFAASFTFVFLAVCLSVWLCMCIYMYSDAGCTTAGCLLCLLSWILLVCFLCLCVCRSACLSVSQSVWLPACLSVGLAGWMAAYLSAFMYFYLSDKRLSVCMSFVCLFAMQSDILSTFLLACQLIVSLLIYFSVCWSVSLLLICILFSCILNMFFCSSIYPTRCLSFSIFYLSINLHLRVCLSNCVCILYFSFYHLSVNISVYLHDNPSVLQTDKSPSRQLVLEAR